jgi:hypothetical protein
MNDPENFLTRWSRRKRAAADDRDREPRDEPGNEQAQRAGDAPSAEGAAADPSPPRSGAVSTPAEPVFDLTKLPSIESITAETDISAFLAPGVPAELKLAALRRAWVTDPKVRDFVGLNDYDFDFHTPGAIPGFGSLQMTDELRQEAMRVVSSWQPKSEPAGESAAAEPASAANSGTRAAQPAAAIEEKNAPAKSIADASGAGTVQPAQDQDELIGSEATTQRSTGVAALQQEHSRAESLQALARRGHGRALPK